MSEPTPSPVVIPVVGKFYASWWGKCCVESIDSKGGIIARFEDGSESEVQATDLEEMEVSS
jgi:hypothetical protein